MVLNVRQKQTESATKLLNLNTPLSSGKDQGDTYKILILDRFCKDVIAPLLRVNDLRKHGITLHLMLEAERQAIPDVPAVYLIQPTAANINRVVQDAENQLYDTMHINFSTSVPRALLEQLAGGIVKAGAIERVSKVYDQYLSFIGLEPTLFSLGLPNVYVELNDPNAKDMQIEASVNTIVDGLLSALITLGTVPIIRCPKGGAAEHVAAQLDHKLRDSLKPRNNLFAESSTGLSASLSRPILCIFDRNFDLCPVLQHAWSYKPLVQDVLGLKLNRVTLTKEAVPPIPGSGSKKSYDVDDKDFFWETCGSYAFPKVAEEVESQVQKYKQVVEDWNKQAGSQGDHRIDQEELLKRNTQHLMSAVSSLPELQEKKRVVDKHTELATVLLQHIKSRALDQYYNLEEDLLTNKGDLAAVLKLARHAKGTAVDKLRLALIYLLSCDPVPADLELTELETALADSNADLTAYQYVRILKRNNLVGSTKLKASSLDGIAALGSQSNLLDWADKTFGVSSVTKSVKNLLSGARYDPVTAAIENLMDGKSGTMEFENFAVFDPKSPVGKVGLDRVKGPFREALVFMIGGGSYLERETITAWASRVQPPRHVVYGTTDLLTAEEFSQQLADLGKRTLPGGA